MSPISTFHTYSKEEYKMKISKMRISMDVDNDISMVREIHIKVLQDFKSRELPKTEVDLQDATTMLWYVSREIAHTCRREIASNNRKFTIGGINISFDDDIDVMRELSRINIGYNENADANDFVSLYIKHAHEILKDYAEIFDFSEINFNGILKIHAQNTPAGVEFFYDARGIKIIDNNLEASEY